MIRPQLASLACLGLALFTVASAAAPRRLFNGHSLAGWSIQNGGHFSVQDGAIRIDHGTGWLRSDETFADFVLVCEFRFLEPGANSGIFVRTGPTSVDDEKGYPNNGYQIQCMDTVDGSNPLGALIPYGAPVGQFQSDREAIKRAYRPTGQWNTFEITCRGETLVVKLNGIQVTTATSIKNLHGHVGLQGELGLLEFRRIEITGLAPAQTALGLDRTEHFFRRPRRTERAHLRIGYDEYRGDLFIMTKADGMIRRVSRAWQARPPPSKPQAAPAT